MAKKNYYYVLVITSSGPVFVTNVDNTNKTAYWEREEKPLELGAYKAKDLVFGLTCNMTLAYVVTSEREIDTQPYNYKDYDFSFVRKEDKEAE